MWESCEVTLTLRLPHDIADQAEAVHAAEPEFLERVVLYGLTRRSIYHQLRDIRADGTQVGFTPAERARFDAEGEALLDKIKPIPAEEQRAILEENGAG